MITFQQVKQTTKAWASQIHNTRHIGDFCQWQDHGAYQKAFERLLRDLKPALGEKLNEPSAEGTA